MAWLQAEVGSEPVLVWSQSLLPLFMTFFF